MTALLKEKVSLVNTLGPFLLQRGLEPFRLVSGNGGDRLQLAAAEPCQRHSRLCCEPMTIYYGRQPVRPARQGTAGG